MLTTERIRNEFEKLKETNYECAIKNTGEYSRIQKEEQDILRRENLKFPISGINTNETSISKDTVIYYTAKDQPGFLEQNDEILSWFDSLSSNGKSDKSNETNESNESNEKVPKEINIVKSKSNNILHELFVAFFGTNSAKIDNIPHFTYLFGGFEEYLVSESISGMTLDKLLPSLSVDEFYSVLLQVVFATIYGLEKFEWTHSNLCNENVVLQSPGAPFKILYPLQNGVYSLDSTRIVTFRDYSKSHIKYAGKHYGTLDCENSIFPTIAFPLRDIYKYLSSSVLSILSSNLKNPEEYLAVCSQFFSYFNNQENVANAVVNQQSTFHSIPNNNYTQKSLSLLGLLEHLSRFEIFSKIVNTTSNYPQLKQHENSSKLSILSYFDSSKRENRLSIKQEILMQKEAIFGNYIQKFDRIRDRILSLKNELNPALTADAIYRTSNEEFFTPYALKVSKEHLFRILEIKFKIGRLEFYLFVGRDVFKDLDLEIYKELGLYDLEFHQLKRESIDIIEHGINFSKAIQIKSRSTFAAEAVRENNDFLWYSKEAIYIL